MDVASNGDARLSEDDIEWNRKKKGFVVVCLLDIGSRGGEICDRPPSPRYDVSYETRISCCFFTLNRFPLSIVDVLL